MRLNFHHAGLQFFFVTLTLAERHPVLSQLVDEKSRPALLPPGETVKATLVAFHDRFPAATVSDFVIMPDHVHFLLIVNYAKEPAFNPLWATHRLMDAVEEAWGEAWKGRGQAPEPPTGENGVILGRGSGAPEPPSFPRFNRSCYLELSFDARQLKAIRHYIRLNPARRLWKLRHPERFARLTNLRHFTLDPARRWDGMGNPTLLASPFLLHVRLTLRKTVEEHAEEIATILEKARHGHISVSGFISPGEKELLHRLKTDPLCRFIKMVPYALPPRYDPSAEDSRELAADRLLILSGFPQGVANQETDFRARCLALNDMAARLCAAAGAGRQGQSRK